MNDDQGPDNAIARPDSVPLRNIKLSEHAEFMEPIDQTDFMLVMFLTSTSTTRHPNVRPLSTRFGLTALHASSI